MEEMNGDSEFSKQNPSLSHEIEQNSQEEQFIQQPQSPNTLTNNWSINQQLNSQISYESSNRISDGSTYLPSTAYATDNLYEKSEIEEKSQDYDEDEKYNSASNSSKNMEQYKLRKQIEKNKKFPPLYDNNTLFIFENNPEEYKKARKRLQNRQSARRIRNFLKNNEESIETNLGDQKNEIQTLKLQVAELTAQNNRLKDEVNYFRGLFRQDRFGQITNTSPNQQQQQQSHLQYQENQSENNNSNDNDEFLQNFQRNSLNPSLIHPIIEPQIYNNSTQDSPKYTRVGSKGLKGNSQYSPNLQLFIVALISCLMIAIYSNNAIGNDQSFKHVNILVQFKKQINQSDDFNQIKQQQNQSQEVEQSMEYLLQQNRLYNNFQCIAFVVGIVMYCILLMHTLLSIYYNKLQKQKHV